MNIVLTKACPRCGKQMYNTETFNADDFTKFELEEFAKVSFVCSCGYTEKKPDQHERGE